MIDLDEIESAARKPWYCRSKLEDNLLSPEVLVELITSLRKAEKDAERYRWLRDEARHHMDCGPLAFMTNYDGDPMAYPECGMVLHESYLDEAIYEAMQCTK